MSKANKKAWDAAHKAAQSVLRKQTRNHKYEPLGNIWYEISKQLRQTGDTVDVDAVNQWWTTESQQRQLMKAILEKAGFQPQGTVYRWADKGGKKKKPDSAPA
ncbi:MAG: hypothetical protein M3Z21_13690 [Pseudomonadota bacterium]|nr:hypothetical protein [Pseudomonadota bacterium]